MICQQQTVAEDAPATRTILPAAGLLSFYFFAAAAVVTALAAAWAACIKKEEPPIHCLPMESGLPESIHPITYPGAL